MKNCCKILLFLFVLTLQAQYEVIKDASGKPVRYAGNYQEKPLVQVPKTPVLKANYMRGVWVATVENIDFPITKSVEDFKKNAVQVMTQLQAAHATAVVFQVRSMNDAFYPSKLAPYSRFLRGTEGLGFPKFDPLAFLISEAHKRGLEFHAWLNPYRVASNLSVGKTEYLKKLSPDNFARKHPEYVIDAMQNGKHYLLLNPGEPAVRSYFLTVINELIMKYPVDAIHLDDYFYPYGGTPVSADAATFAKHGSKKMTLDEWRRNNVNLLVSGIHTMIERYNKKNRRHIQFGISPFGIWGNAKTTKGGSMTGGMESRTKIYADTWIWIRNGWLDYVCPQLYWGFSNNVAAYAHLTDWWASAVRGTKTKLYIGHAVYRLGSTQEWQNPLEIYNQMRYNLKTPGVSGSILFSYSKFIAPKNTVMKTGCWKIKEFWGTAK